MDADKKSEKLSVKDFVKGPPALRLKSIKLPRDLSLGRNKSYKRIYTPNLNVVRKKHYASNKSIDQNDTKIKQQKEKAKEKPQFVQSKGIFTERKGTSKATIRKERDILDNIVPIFSNKKSIGLNKKQEFIREDIKQNLEDTDEQKSSFSPVEWDESSLSNSCIPPKMEPFWNSDNSQTTYYLWQLPISFHFKKEQGNDFTLKDFPEGTIGKLCVKKSGKVQVVIGKLSYKLDSSSHWDSPNEHLVSTQINNKESHATVLGSVTKTYILDPDWDYLLNI
ncbi:uncharacterized protein LOC130897861 [Diorhabda carinulata]|uniref:uncharacterized protein LOC130897861 n=1 Tax=Diorhabda carinulata TaxID=1163345 RepID=UPI0025A1B240|nr:uncharacterized protein LOC130897861 [Diorhabda carinulata]